MRKIAVFLIMVSLSMTGYLIQGTGQIAEAEKPISAGNILYVDDDGGSTYTNINAALQDVSPGDTINVAPGDYSTTSVANKQDLTIIGNNSAGEVTIFGTVEFIPIWFYRSTNITMYGFTFDGEGTSTVTQECQDITLAFNRFQSRGTLHEAVSIQDSDDVSILWCVITGTSSNSYGIELDKSDNFNADIVIFEMTGLNTGAIEAVNCNNVVLSSVNGTYSGYFVDAQSSTVTTIDTVVPNAYVSVDGNSQIDVEFFRRVIVKEEDNSTKLGDVEFEFRINDAPVYQTTHYGGTDAVSNVDGIFPAIPNLVQKRFVRSSTPTYFPNTMKFYYDGLDVPTEVDLGEIDAGITDELHVLFPDMRFPEPPQNVTAKTVDEDTIEIWFDASPSEDVVNYEIWYNESSEWIHVLNTSTPGNHYFHELEPYSFHEYRIMAVDDVGLESEWVIFGNRTSEATKGRISGNVTYLRGPLHGMNVVNAIIELDNLDDNRTANTTTDLFGNFDLGIHPFMDRYRIMVYPPDYVIPGHNETGYPTEGLVFDHSEDTELEIFTGYYEYQPPTKGRISGRITYEDGPMMGMNSTNASVFLLNETLVEIENMTVNDTGLYLFRGVPFNANYTMWIIPENEVGWNGTESGYVKEVLHFFFDEEMEKNVSLSYFDYTIPTWADIFGRVVYENGPKAGEGAQGARVELLVDGGNIRSEITNNTGHFLLDYQAYGTNFTIRITPNEDDLGEIDAASGYLPKTSPAFDHLAGIHEKNMVLEYYEHTVAVEHPSVTILDDNGDPLPDVVVVVTVDGTKYSAVTDENGVAEFDRLPGTEFPEGATFEGIKDGYQDLEWTEGEEVPMMIEDNGEKPNDLLLIMIIGLIIILVVGVLFMLLRKSGVEEEEYSEE